MNRRTATLVMTPAGSRGDSVRALPAKGPFSEIVVRWRQGEPPNTCRVLAEHPELELDKSLVLDLIYEEFCLRVEAGEVIDPDEFSRRFPRYRNSVRRLVVAHHYFDENTRLAEQQSSVHWPEPGESFLGFSLIAALGRGTFAKVFLASQPALGDRLVAVKVAFKGAAEAETLGRLRHPNIVPVYSVQEEESSGLSVVCMPYLGTATLCDVLDRAFASRQPPTRADLILHVAADNQHPLLAEATSKALWQKPDPVLCRRSYADGIVHLGCQLAEALAHTHAQGICHRDLKPSNVLLTPEGKPMLLDFNLSFDERLSGNVMGGTLPYMSPEQLRSTGFMQTPADTVDARSDIFSLAVILYELLTGSLPFGPIPPVPTIPQMREFLLQRQEKGPQPLRQLNPQVDKNVARLIERCLASEPSERPASAAEVAAALKRSLSLPHRARRWVANHARAVFALAAVLVLTSLAGGYYATAIRDPYSIRQLNHGKELYQRGDYREAVRRLSQAVEADPTMAEAYFARGRAYQRLGELAPALSDYQSANRLAPEDGRVMAAFAYCVGQQKHDEAIAYYEQARKVGFENAETLNNQGHHRLKGARHELPKLAQAAECFAKALSMDPTLQATYHNRILLNIQTAQARNWRQTKRQAVLSKSWYTDIEQALHLGPVTGELHADCARLYAIAAQTENQNWSQLALQHASKARLMGKDHRKLLKEGFFTDLEDSQFGDLLSQPPVEASSPPSVLLVDPVKD